MKGRTISGAAFQSGIGFLDLRCEPSFHPCTPYQADAQQEHGRGLGNWSGPFPEGLFLKAITGSITSSHKASPLSLAANSFLFEPRNANKKSRTAHNVTLSMSHSASRLSLEQEHVQYSHATGRADGAMGLPPKVVVGFRQ